MENHANDFSLIIPVLSSDIEFIRREDGQDLVFNTNKGYRLKISQEVFLLLHEVNGRNSIVDISETLQTKYRIPITSEEIYSILYGKLAEYGCIVNGKEVFKAVPTYLKLRMPLIKNSISCHVTKYCKWLCRPKLFYPLFIVTFLYLILFSIFNWHSISSGLKEIDIIKSAIVFIISTAGVFCHEFGHVASCDFFGAKHGDIGFGFYLFTPVMYADISDVWRLPSRQRIICNLAGMYFGNLFCAAMSVVYLISRQPIFLYISLVEFIQSLYNLNPLVKYDGYWVMSDMLDVSNLHTTSYSLVKNFAKNYKKYSWKDWILSVYGIVSMSYIFILVLWMIVFTPDSIIRFPINLYHYVICVMDGNIPFDLSGLTQFVLPAFFYWLIIRWLKRVLRKRKQKE